MKNIFKICLRLVLISLSISITTPVLGQVLDNPLGQDALSPQALYGRLIFGFMGITGVVALLMFLVGGFQWMTAGGNADKVKKGQDTLTWALLGLAVIFASYAILKAIFKTLQF